MGAILSAGRVADKGYGKMVRIYKETTDDTDSADFFAHSLLFSVAR
jgi:hypothetical protein